MSVPPQHAQVQGGVSQPVEDCRDYLRTGRCKYGASCKYNHPANVQNGGGMKAPIDPSEPLFPIRPSEPVCQYYMKHGTCKFGQACKFHHPPNLSPGHSVSSPHMMMNSNRKNDSPAPLVLNPVLTDSGGQGMVLQLLPQRPDEPDCIYFLKNGRCKYGATCRYHHPVNYHQQQRRSEKPRRPVASQAKVQQYVINGYPHGQVVVSDNNTPYFISVDGTGAQGYHLISTTDGMTSYCVQTGAPVRQEQGSSGSSIGSYETAKEHLGESASAYWNRAKRNGSGGSLSAHVNENRARNGTFIHHSASEGNMDRRTRTASYGSVSEASAYYDTAATLPRNGSSGSWRNGPANDRGQAYDGVQQRRTPLQQFTVLDDGRIFDHKTGQIRSRPQGMNPQHIRQRSARGENDEGFTMMTSALLHMLDTPEEGSGEGFGDDDYAGAHPGYSPEYRQAHTDYQMQQHGMVDPAMFERLSINDVPPGFSAVPHQLQRGVPQNAYPVASQQSETSLFEQLTMHQHNSMQNQGNHQGGQSQWSPTWQGSTGHGPDGTPHTMPMLHPSHGHGQSASHDNDVGLFLP